MTKPRKNIKKCFGQHRAVKHYKVATKNIEFLEKNRGGFAVSDVKLYNTTVIKQLINLM